jgi:hypothetical protein
VANLFSAIVIMAIVTTLITPIGLCFIMSREPWVQQAHHSNQWIITTASRREIVDTPNFCYEYILDPIVFRPAVHYKNKDLYAEATTLMDTANEFK